MIIKLKNSIVLVFGMISISALSDEYCTNSGDAQLTLMQCVTTGLSVSGAVNEGVNAHAKFSEASIYEKAHTKVWTPESIRVQEPEEIKLLKEITDGDKIAVNYELSDEANRQYHIEKMESNASSARTQASYHLTQSLTAMETVYEDVPDGRGGTTRRAVGQRPDYAARAYNALRAIELNNEASDYDEKARNARNGGPVPTYNFDKTIDTKVNSKMTTNSFLEKLRIEGSKIQQMTRLPVTHNLVVKNLSKKAWWSVGTAALATGLAIEEVVSGQVAKSLEGVTGIRDKIRKRTQARQRQQGYNYRGSDPE